MLITRNKIHRKFGKTRIRTRWLIHELIDSQLKPTSLECPICDYLSLTSEFRIYESHCIFGGGKLIRYECPTCGLIFGTHRMLSLSPQKLGKEYTEHYSFYNEGNSTELELKTFQYLQPKREGIYLNYGCGRWSDTIQEVNESGYKLFGFDPYASHNNNKFVISDIRTLKSMKFDGIMSNDVLEHLRYPCKTLLFMSSLLKDNCSMVHKTPCYKYCYEYTRFHLYFFTGKSLSIICDKADLIVEDTDRFDTKIFYKNLCHI